MSTEEILSEIYKSGNKAEILLALLNDLIEDNKELKSRFAESNATVNAVRKIARRNKDASSAIEGIKALCEEE